MRPRISPLVLASLLLLAACSSTRQTSSASPDSGESRAAAPDEAEGKLRKAEAKVAGLLRKKELGSLDLRLATLSTEAKRKEANLAVETARRAVFAAREELSSAKEVEAKLEQDKAQLAVERAAHRVETAQTDLRGILEIYAEEVEARSRDAIIHRHKKSVEFAEAELELARAQAQQTVEFKVPAKIEKLEWALAAAEAKLKAAESALERVDLEARLELARKEASQKDLESELDEAVRAQAKAREGSQS